MSTRIEHLPDHILARFAPMLLGVYHPRLLLMTTPNYSYNELFSPPGVISEQSFLDPTQKTDRRFRHYDHKFEWTPEEFMQYCLAEAENWGYEATSLDTIGSHVKLDPWGRGGGNEQMKGATFVVAFKRQDGASSVKKGSASDWLSKNQRDAAHEPILSLLLNAHESARKENLTDFADISNSVFSLMNRLKIREIDSESVWLQHSQIAIDCGGRLDRLIQSLQHDQRFEADTSGSFGRDSWIFRLI